VSSSSDLTRFGRIYVSAVLLLGFFVIGESLIQLYRFPIGTQWLLLALLTLISGSASVELPHSNITISISEAFVFSAVLLYGPAAGTLTVALDGLVISLWIAKRRPELHRAMFNISAPALSAWFSAQLFFKVSRIAPLADRPASELLPLNQILPALALFAVAYFGLNSWLIAIRIALHRRVSPLQVWRDGFMWLSLNYFCGASVAVLLVGYTRTIDLRFVGVVVPLLLVLYFTFKTSMQRVEDAYKHVAELNSLYLSTIETLAMAIDAKDQITHGHIRRVQSFAVGLAKEVGVADEQLIKAIEAAALLHDMGKLAVPEYILNKPGKLSPVEFEKMKLHATVGADILSSIEFPYPVVPIVRHHHENWDGTGYPQGLRGTEIPIGARILMVVDCFDALTSDRPYRPRLSDQAALDILRDRKSTMYDPLVVDAFARVYKNLLPTPLQSRLSKSVLHEIATTAMEDSAQVGCSALGRKSATADVPAYKPILAVPSVSYRAQLIAADLRRSIPYSLFVFFLHDQSRAELQTAYATGEPLSVVRDLRIPLGKRLSGWVAVNRRTIVNSDPALDLGDDVLGGPFALHSCLCTPIVSNDVVIGVLALYSAAENGFDDTHRLIVEATAREAESILEQSAEFADLHHV